MRHLDPKRTITTEEEQIDEVKPPLSFLYSLILGREILGTLERWARVGQQLHEVSLEPGTGFRRGLQRIALPAVEVVARRRRVRGAVAFTARLDPDKGILQLEASVRSRASTETRTDSVAPVAPLELTSRLLARTTLVCDKMSIPPLLRKQRCKRLHVEGFVVVRVTFWSAVSLVHRW